MKKKGFTLIEIIISISVITLIGVASIVGVRLVNKSIKNNKLEDISDKIKEAVSVYVETNENVKQQLYSNNNGIYVPLNVLKNEGLIDFQDIKITDKDYVLTMLGSSSSDGACVDTTTIGSWEDGNKTIYLCTDKNGNSNVTSVGFAGNNLSLTSKNRVYFYTNYLGEAYGIEASAEAKANNYITYKDKTYKIYYIDRDDSLALLSYDSFGNTFDGKTQKINANKRKTGCDETEHKTTDYPYSLSNTTNLYAAKDDVSFIENNGEVPLSMIELYKGEIHRDSFLHASIFNILYSADGSSEVFCSFYCNSWSKTWCTEFKDNSKLFKIHLKPCMKINGGSGDSVNPYILKDYCS